MKRDGILPNLTFCHLIVIPIHKMGSTNDVNNYRHISLLSTFSKAMEKLMTSRLKTLLKLYLSFI